MNRDIGRGIKRDQEEQKRERTNRKKKQLKSITKFIAEKSHEYGNVKYVLIMKITLKNSLYQLRTLKVQFLKSYHFSFDICHSMF